MKLSWLRKAKVFSVYVVVISFITIAVGCGGGGSYDAPDSQSATPIWWDTYDQPASAVVSASDVAGWIANGNVTASGDPVVILDVQTDFSDTAANRIIGSTSIEDIEAFTIFDYRAEGPIDTVAINDTSAKMVPKGTTIDAMLQDLGVTHDTVIVLTSAASGNGVWNLTRGWWMLYYWGLAETKIKILDGGVAALAAADPTLVNTTAESVDPADSVFSVKDLPGLHTSSRVSTTQVINYARSGSAKIIDARGSSGTSGVAFGGRIDGAIVAGDAGIGGGDLVNADGTFKTKAEMQAAFDNAGISANDRIIVHCFSGYSATPIYFFIKEVMEYENVALYDGSWSAWSAHSAFTPVAATYIDGATTIHWDGSQFVQTVADTVVPTTDITQGGVLEADTNAGMLAYDTVRLSKDILFKAVSAWQDAYGNTTFTVNTEYTGSGTELATEDVEYVTSDDVTGDDSSGDGEDVVVSPDTGGC
ncbi:Rhodanese domain protein [Denitrovibrio acetiphilus DSM 12809]|uniref:Rhodanese domain protein n=1 Tax=Denitrovibrio acetiphilus (strain DSM 12809 / NBRC 114555 / N2460) TaxID=522772 RepID=D4H0N8_DENA2|nr:rhodanese-like domain-containing protein [Denitrovibrio acetiphilus]ADD68551.1 Rhodanese domain protein [Denitrovibrio acetiphilus DSM 12809]